MKRTVVDFRAVSVAAAFYLLAVPGIVSGAGVDYVEGEANVAARATLAPGSTVETGDGSQAQVALGRGVVRMGSGTVVETRDDRGSIDLKEGVMVASSGPGFFRPSVGVHMEKGKISATTKGTALVAYYPEKYIKVTCVEGKVRVDLKALLGEFVTLQPAQMVIINPTDPRLPEPVEIDLQRLVETSPLLERPFHHGMFAAAIEGNIQSQAAALASGKAELTPLVLRGASPTVQIAVGHARTVAGAGGEGGGGGGGGDPGRLAAFGFAPSAPSAPSAPVAPVAPAGGGDGTAPGGGGRPGPGGGPAVPGGDGGPVDPPGSGRPSNAAFVVDGTSTIRGDGITTPGYGTVPGGGVAGERSTFTFPPGGPGTDAEVSFQGEVLIDRAQLGNANTGFRTPGILDVSGTVRSSTNLTFIGRDVSVFGTIDTFDPLYGAPSDITVISEDGGVLNITDSRLVGGNLSITNVNLGPPSPDPRGDWIPFPNYPTDIFNSQLHAPGFIGIHAGGPDNVLVVENSQVGTSPNLTANLPSASAIVIDSSSPDPSNPNAPTNEAVLVTGSNLGGANTGRIEVHAEQGTARVSASNLRAEGPGGLVRLAGQTVTVADSSQLYALAQIAINADAGATIDQAMLTSGGNLGIDAASVHIRGSQLMGDVISIVARGPAGDALIIDNSTLTAASLIDLYAQGSSTLRFIGNVHLNSPLSELRASAVQVDAGGSVNGAGAVNVHANDHRYNKAGFGTLNGSPLTQSPSGPAVP